MSAVRIVAQPMQGFLEQGTYVPRAFAERFNKALAAVLADAEVKKRIAEMAHDLAPTTLEEAAAEMEAGANFWKEAAKSPDFVRP